MLCKISRSEVHGVRSVWHGYQTGIGCVFLSMCIFLYTRVFYRCPTTSVAPRLENTCRPGRKFFLFQNHYRPCVDHNAVQATPDCVHRVTVLCCAVYLVAYERPTWCVWSMLCHIARAVPLCPTRLCSSPAVLCSVSTVLCSMLCMSIPLAGGGGW